MTDETEKQTVLVVDDEPANIHALGALLKDEYRVQVANSGDKALGIIQDEARSLPDMILLDIQMPGIDGYEVCRRLKDDPRTEAIVVIFVTARDATSDEEYGLRLGAADYISKPISPAIVRARVDTHMSLKRKTNMLEASNEELTAYYRRSQIENELAQQMIERIVANAGTDDSQIDQSVQSVDDFSGDVISTITLESGQTYAMLADATGHGLPAAITLLPAMEIFYQMSQRGYSVAAIVRQINRRMRERLPPNYFLAANVMLINPQQQTLCVWNGCCPCAYVLSENEGISQRIHSAHPPLGILDDSEFDDRVHLCHVGPNDRVFACSDGLTEARNESSEMFGITRLETLLQSCASDTAHRTPQGHMPSLIDCAKKGLAQFRGRALPDDDQSMMVLGVEMPSAFDTVRRVQNTRSLRHDDDEAARSGWEFELELRGTDLRRIEIIPTVNQMLEHLMLDRDTRQRAFVVMTELISNALDHGVLELDPVHKTDEDGFERYFEQRRERMDRLDQGFIKIAVSRSALLEHGLLRLMISDSGPGFDALVDDATSDVRRFYGRGLQLVSNLADGLRFLDKGASVEAEFRIE